MTMKPILLVLVVVVSLALIAWLHTGPAYCGMTSPVYAGPFLVVNPDTGSDLVAGADLAGHECGIVLH